MDGTSRSWQPTPRTDDSGYGERMTNNNNRPPRREEFKVYIKNVPLDMTKESLEGMFSSCGTVVSTNIMAPREGRNSTIGFVGFSAEEAVNNAIDSMTGTVLGDCHLVVEKATPKDRGGAPRRDQESQFQRRGDFQTGHQNERPSFQGYRAQNEQPQRDGNVGQPNYSNGPSMTNNYQGGMGVRQEEAVFNPRGPGRGGNPNEQTSFQGYQTQNYSGNMGQHNYSQQAVNGPEMMNNNQGMDVRHEEAVYNPRGPGRGGGIQNEQQSFQGYQMQNYNEQPLGGGNVGQQSYSQPEITNYHQSAGVRHEEATFNPRGPGRGGGIINQPSPAQAPGRGNSYMNGMSNDYTNVEGQGNSDSWKNEGQQQWGHNTQQQDMSMTGRLPQGISSQDSYSKPEQSGGQSCYKCGEVGHFARECPNQEDRGGKGGQGCHKCGEVGHFARDCPSQVQGERKGRGDQTCHKCGEVGHFSRDCTSSGGLDRACHKCGDEGHFARECPTQTSSSPEKGGQSCYKCGEVGHFARECPNQEQNGEKGGQSCYKCGEVGHFARECPNQEENGGPENKVAPVTYIPPELPSNIDELFQDAMHSGLNFDKYDEIPVKVTGKEIPPAISMFEEAGILEQCTLNIKRAQFTKPTPIQKHAIPITLAGRDLMACAQTGSGKTVAYLVPVLTSMIKQGHLSGGYLTGETQAPAALCLAPTRELAVQIHKEVCKFANGTVVSAAVCYGGVSVQHQLDKIRRGCHFLIATPGRLIDFVNRNRVTLANVRYMILDEADRMLDMGFEQDVRKIVERSGMPDKSQRQTLMYSATFPDEIQRLAADFLKEQYLFVVVGKIGGSNLDICQSVISVPGDDKQEKLFDILLNSGTDRTLIFVELKRVADFLACLLSQNNFPTTSISGDRTQQEREAALLDFRSGRAPVLVATSVAARGLDIPDVKHVINFDLPQDIEEYVHRIGRTGRIGNKGKATSFFQPGKDERIARSLVKILSEAYQEVPEWLEQVAEEAIGSSYGPAGGKFASKDRREREHSRSSASDQSRMSGSADGMGAVTRGMERVSVQPPSQYPRNTQCTQDEDAWD